MGWCSTSGEGAVEVRESVTVSRLTPAISHLPSILFGPMLVIVSMVYSKRIGAELEQICEFYMYIEF